MFFIYVVGVGEGFYWLGWFGGEFEEMRYFGLIYFKRLVSGRDEGFGIIFFIGLFLAGVRGGIRNES